MLGDIPRTPGVTRRDRPSGSSRFFHRRPILISYEDLGFAERFWGLQRRTLLRRRGCRQSTILEGSGCAGSGRIGGRRVARSSRVFAGPMQAVGGLFAMSADAVRFVFRRPFQWREFLEQCWFIARVSLAPTLLVAIPFTVLVSFTLNILLRELGAADLQRRGCGVRRGHPGRPAGDGVDRGRRGRHGDVCGPGLAHHPRRDRRDGGAGHQPGAAVGDAADAGLGSGGAAAEQPGGASSASWAAMSSRCSSRT